MTRLNPTLLASLLLHLAVLYAASGLLRMETVRDQPSSGTVVAYLDLGVDRVGGAASRHLAPQESGVTGDNATAMAPAPAPVRAAAGQPSQPLQSSTPPALPVTAPGGSTTAAGKAGGPAKVAGEGGAPQIAGAGLTESKSAAAGAGPVAVSGPRGGGVAKGSDSPSSSRNSLQRRGAYQAQLRSLIEAHKVYPLAARKSGREGSCQRRFVLGRDGSLKRVETLSSCGHPFLDAAATNAISAVGGFPPLPEEFPGAEESFSITMTFTLANR